MATIESNMEVGAQAIRRLVKTPLTSYKDRVLVDTKPNIMLQSTQDSVLACQAFRDYLMEHDQLSEQDAVLASQAFCDSLIERDQLSDDNSQERHQGSNDYLKEFLKSLMIGWSVVGLTTPFISPLNFASLYAANHNKNTLDALKAIKVNPLRGAREHILKEIPRTAIKSVCLRDLRPYLNKKYPNNPVLANLLFAVTASILTEVTVNPLEVIKVQLQDKKPIQGLMRGVEVSVLRQIPIWGLFGIALHHANNFLQSQGRDPNEYKWIPFKAAWATLYFSPLTYLAFGRIRYEMQTGASTIALKQQGWDIAEKFGISQNSYSQQISRLLNHYNKADPHYDILCKALKEYGLTDQEIKNCAIDQHTENKIQKICSNFVDQSKISQEQKHQSNPVTKLLEEIAKKYDIKPAEFSPLKLHGKLHNQNQIPNLTFYRAAQNIISHQGPKGLVYGMGAKALSDWVLPMGAITIAQAGKNKNPDNNDDQKNWRNREVTRAMEEQSSQKEK